MAHVAKAQNVEKQYISTKQRVSPQWNPVKLSITSPRECNINGWGQCGPIECSSQRHVATDMSASTV